MCANFSATKNTEWVREHWDLALPCLSEPEVYPTGKAPIVVQSRQSGRRACGEACFGLIPAWSKDGLIARHTYNARTETVATKPSYRNAWKHGQFALVLVDHFYEPSYETGRAVRWKIQLKDCSPFAIACLWERWVNPQNGESIASFSMLTINADSHPVMNQFHKVGDEKRTPVIITPENFATWLTASSEQAIDLLQIQYMPELLASESIK